VSAARTESVTEENGRVVLQEVPAPVMRPAPLPPDPFQVEAERYHEAMLRIRAIIDTPFFQEMPQSALRTIEMVVDRTLAPDRKERVSWFSVFARQARSL
jgi:hypothetical protein